MWCDITLFVLLVLYYSALLPSRYAQTFLWAFQSRSLLHLTSPSLGWIIASLFYLKLVLLFGVLFAFYAYLCGCLTTHSHFLISTKTESEGEQIYYINIYEWGAKRPRTFHQIISIKKTFYRLFFFTFFPVVYSCCCLVFLVFFLLPRCCWCLSLRCYSVWA